MSTETPQDQPDQESPDPAPPAAGKDGEERTISRRPAVSHGLPPGLRRELEEIRGTISRVDSAVFQSADAKIVVNAMADLFADVRRVADQAAAQLSTDPRFLDLGRRLAEFRQEVLRPSLTDEVRVSLSHLAEALRQAYAPNWVGLDTDLDVEGALFGLAREGISVVWVPRAALVQRLVDLPNTNARRKLLAEASSEIVEDCSEAIDRVTQQHAVLQPYRARLAEALEAHRVGLPSVAQAMSAVVLTALLQWVFAHARLASVKKSVFRAPDEDEVELWQLKIALLIEAAVPAVQGGRDELPDDQLAGFNRHDTLHRVADQAYTLPNAMTCLLLATGLLLEADQMMGMGLLQT